MRPGIDRIRGVFDYERAGGSPLLGVKGTVIITHGRAKRRMVGFACEVAATMARTRVPALIADALAADARQAAATATETAPRPGPGGRAMSGPELTVGRGVIAELVRLAAFEVPGVSPGRPRRSGLAGLAARPGRSGSGSRTSASSSGCASSPGRARRSGR